MLADLTEEEVVDMVVAGWDERLPEMMMYGKGWNEAAASIFPSVVINFVKAETIYTFNVEYLRFGRTLSCLWTDFLLLGSDYGPQSKFSKFSLLPGSPCPRGMKNMRLGSLI
jgi:hypothetical protein